MTHSVRAWAMALALVGLTGAAARAQGEADERPVQFNGMAFRSPDSLFYINFRFRMQNRVGLATRSARDLNVQDYDARVRRLRLRADGFVLGQRIGYSLQLAFARGDQDFENTGVANIVRDAVIFYNVTPNFYLAFGLNKLPGNRQRVTSSGQLQFAERSIVNTALNIDRDFGLKAYYTGQLGEGQYALKGAVTTGEGRSANGTDSGLCYTGRAEWLPLGAFHNGGDYSEGDLAREPAPRLSVAAGYSFNRRTTRSGGQLGPELYTPVDLGTFIADAVLKYRGWAYLSEYLSRRSPAPFTTDAATGDVRYAYVGRGLNQQVSYLLRSNWEPALRYSWLQPARALRLQQPESQVLELGLTRYLRQHRVKAQLNASYLARQSRWSLAQPGNRWAAVFQFELGI